jgi:glycosyltransferase involved in cell wall biosynthesis
MIIGDGRERPRLEILARILGISDRVVWTGMLHGAPLVERLAACDVFLSASTTEVQPLVFLEAMALGLPAIGVRAGGVPELVSDGRSGCLVTADDPEALAQAMHKLFTDDTLRGALGDGACEVVKSFEAGRVVAELVGLYEEVCTERPGRSNLRAIVPAAGVNAVRASPPTRDPLP